MRIAPGQRARALKRAVRQATDVHLEYLTVKGFTYCRTQRGHGLCAYHRRVDSPLPWQVWEPVDDQVIRECIDELLARRAARHA